ncbi:MAG: cytochrome c oxidase subunit II [Hyphomicrobiaceae bacterium]
MVDGLKYGAPALLGTVATATGAAAGTGAPSPWQMGLQEPVTAIAGTVYLFHDFINIVVFVIAAFVLVLLGYAVFRFNEKSHPQASLTTHNTTLEVLWTVVPIVILVAIAIPSFRLLYQQYAFPKPDLTIKAIGNAWFWEHEYPDQGGFKVTSIMVRDEDLLEKELGKAEFDRLYGRLEGTARLKALYAGAAPLWKKLGEPRLLAVDNTIAVPVGKVVHVLVTATDVIHAWTIPSFGVKTDAVPGRVTATWFRATKKGIYYGQCSELCGKDHAFMPIAVRVVDETVFDDWAAAAKARDLKRAGAILKASRKGPRTPKVAEAPR